MRHLKIAAAAVVMLFFTASGYAQISTPEDVANVIDRVVQQEHHFATTMRQYAPVEEAYIQTLKQGPERTTIAGADTYFLGRLNLSHGLYRATFTGKKGGFMRLSMQFKPEGMAVITPDETNFDRSIYKFASAGEELLGSVHCMVFSVSPKVPSKQPRFVGQIWVEDQDFHIVRFRGTYIPNRTLKYYFHFDSWRTNVAPGVWIPEYVFFEEPGLNYGKGQHGGFRAEVRFWGFDRSASPATDGSNSEQTLLARMEHSGLLAPAGDVDRLMNNVLRNLLRANDIDIPNAQCRTLLTTPLDTFTIGHTIFVSRGLIETVPDEASLTAVLAHNVAHMLIHDNRREKLAFSDSALMPNRNTLQRLQGRHDKRYEAEVDSKAMSLLHASQYKDQLANAALFLRMVQQRSATLRSLIPSHLASGTSTMMPELISSLFSADLRSDALAALPAHARLNVNPWNDRLELRASDPKIAPRRDKVVFDLIPSVPVLERVSIQQSGALRGAQ